MEIKRKQKVLRCKFWFRFFICLASLISCSCYLFFGNNSHIWSVIVGISGSALVWALVELFDFFVQTHHKYESERNLFLEILTDHFSEMKSRIRTNRDNFSMNEIKIIVNNLYDKTNRFLFSSEVYAISSEFKECCNYLERLRWKFEACCAKINKDCDKSNEYYQKLYTAILTIEEKQETTSKRLFTYASANKSTIEIADIELSFEDFNMSKDIIDHNIIGNIHESFSIPGNILTTITFTPDLSFEHIFKNEESKTLRTVISLIKTKID